jgi:signal transduction histidine kinase
MAQDLQDVILHVDKNKFAHLIRILLTNAIRYSPQPSIITVAIELQKISKSRSMSNNNIEKYCLKIVISDKGCGFPLVSYILMKYIRNIMYII